MEQSGAIIEYLVDTYDKQGRLTYDTLPEKYQIKSWLCFQMSGQGIDFGYAIHFRRTAQEMALEWFRNKIKRIVDVLDKHLKRSETGFLVGDRITYADLAFVPWNDMLEDVMRDWDFATDAPIFAAWQKGMMERESVKRVWTKRAAMEKWFKETRPASEFQIS